MKTSHAFFIGWLSFSLPPSVFLYVSGYVLGSGYVLVFEIGTLAAFAACLLFDWEEPTRARRRHEISTASYSAGNRGSTVPDTAPARAEQLITIQGNLSVTVYHLVDGRVVSVDSRPSGAAINTDFLPDGRYVGPHQVVMPDFPANPDPDRTESEKHGLDAKGSFSSTIAAPPPS